MSSAADKSVRATGGRFLLWFGGCGVQLRAGLAVGKRAEVGGPLVASQVAVKLGAGICDEVRASDEVLGDVQIGFAGSGSQETPSEHEVDEEYAVA